MTVTRPHVSVRNRTLFPLFVHGLLPEYFTKSCEANCNLEPRESSGKKVFVSDRPNRKWCRRESLCNSFLEQQLLRSGDYPDREDNRKHELPACYYCK